MQIKRLHIEHFRPIKTLDFDPGSYCVLTPVPGAGPRRQPARGGRRQDQTVALRLRMYDAKDPVRCASAPRRERGGWILERDTEERLACQEHETLALECVHHDKCPNDVLFWMKPDFETASGLPHAETAKIDRALERLSAVAENGVPDILRPVIAKVVEPAQ